jgi:hypothetical protein
MIVMSVACLNSFGIAVTKYSSATLRTVGESLRIIIIWLFFMSIGHELFNFVQLIGFSVMLFGSLIYNEIIHIPVFNLHHFTEKRQKELEEKLLADQNNTIEGDTRSGDEYSTNGAGATPNNNNAQKIKMI